MRPVLRVLPRSGATRRGWTGSRALAAFVGVSFLYFGLRLFLYPPQAYVGFSTDPQIFIWSFAWWPHAILHGENPFFTHAIWAPSGVNLTWTTTVPGSRSLFSPLTLLAGPVVSYNVAAILMPALSAWTAFLLCRYLTSAVWPSLVGGYLFGFSSYVLGQAGGAPAPDARCSCVPLVALVVLRFVERRARRPRARRPARAAARAAQLLFSTEVAFTLTLALAAAARARRSRSSRPPRGRARLAARPLLGSPTRVAAVLTAPFLYFLLTGFQGGVQAARGLPRRPAQLLRPDEARGLGRRLAHRALALLPRQRRRAGRVPRPCRARDRRAVRLAPAANRPRPLPARAARARRAGARSGARSTSTGTGSWRCRGTSSLPARVRQHAAGAAHRSTCRSWPR